MQTRHFLTLMDFSKNELQKLMQRAIELKKMQRSGHRHEPLRNKVMAMVFEKSSTRTRLSFETAMVQLGGHAIFLSPRDTQLGRGEPIEDTARVISSMVDVIMVRTYEHEKIERLAQYSKVPVINGLTDQFHPCQLLADIQTYIEQRGSIQGKIVTWIGDGNNMCHTYVHAAEQFDFELRIACPEHYQPDATIVAPYQHRVSIMRDTKHAAKNADLIVTDVWASMGQEQETQQRRHAFAAYQVDDDTMAHAKSDALFMHCLPAHRGEEVSASVIEGAQSAVWEEAENRLHSQKALIEFLLER